MKDDITAKEALLFSILATGICLMLVGCSVEVIPENDPVIQETSKTKLKLAECRY